MAIGPVDIEFVLRGDIEDKLKSVGSTVKGEGKSIEDQMRRLTGAGTDAFDALSKSAQMQAQQLERINSAIEQNAQKQEALKEKLEAGRISAEDYNRALSILAVQKRDLSNQAANLEKQVTSEIQSNQMVTGSIDEMNVRLARLREEYNRLSDAERNEFGGKLQKEMSALSKELDNASASGKGLLGTMRDAPGPIGSATRGVEQMTRAALRFIATPIGAIIAAIVVGLKALSSWFKRTEEGQNQLARSTGYFKQVLDNLLDVVDKVGEWLFKAFTKPKEALNDILDFLKGQIIYRFEAIGKMGAAITKIFSKDWKEGLNDMNNAVLQFQTGIKDAGERLSEWGKNVVDNANKRAEIEDQLFKLKVQERKMNEEIAASEVRISELRSKGRDIELPDAERLAALKEAQSIIEANYQKEIDLATRRRDLVAEQKGLSHSNMQDNEEISRMNVEILNLQARSADEQRELMREINSLSKAVGKNAAEGVAAIQQELETLQAAILDADGELQKAIARRILGLQKELQIRLDNADAALLAARNEASGSNIVPPQLGSLRAEIDKTFKAQQNVVNDTGLEVDKLSKKIKENAANVRKWIGEWNQEHLEQFLNTSSQILDVAGGIVQKNQELLGLNDDQARVIDNTFKMMSGMADIASGNIVGGVAKMVDGAIELFMRVPEEMNVRFEQLAENITKVINSIDIAGAAMQRLGNTDVNRSFSVINSQLRSIADAAKQINDELEGKSYGPRPGGSTSVIYREMRRDVSQLSEELEKLIDRLLGGNLSDAQRKAIDAVLDQYNELMAKIDDITQQLIGTTAGELANSLADAFLIGIDAAEDWGSAVDDIIKHVIRQQLTASMLAGPVQEAIDRLIKDTEGGLTTDEALKFKESMDALAESVAPAFAAARDALESIGIDIGDGSATSRAMTGAIRALTEETGGMIYGQLMAVRYDIKEIIAQSRRNDDLVNMNLSYLSQIAANTNHNARLVSIDDRLREMNVLLKNI